MYSYPSQGKVCVNSLNDRLEMPPVFVSWRIPVSKPHTRRELVSFQNKTHWCTTPVASEFASQMTCWQTGTFRGVEIEKTCLEFWTGTSFFFFKKKNFLWASVFRFVNCEVRALPPAVYTTDSWAHLIQLPVTKLLKIRQWVCCSECCTQIQFTQLKSARCRISAILTLIDVWKMKVNFLSTDFVMSNN